MTRFTNCSTAAGVTIESVRESLARAIEIMKDCQDDNDMPAFRHMVVSRKTRDEMRDLFGPPLCDESGTILNLGITVHCEDDEVARTRLAMEIGRNQPVCVEQVIDGERRLIVIDFRKLYDNLFPVSFIRRA